MPGNPRAQTAAAAQQSKGFPPGFKSFSAFPFAGMNVQDSPIGIDDKEFTLLENFLRIGAAKLRTAWDVGASIYTAPTDRTIVSFFFYTIGTVYYAAVFLNDGSAIQINLNNLQNTQIGPPGTFYNINNAQLPACAQWGTLYLLISNRNTTNDYWAWDGSILYTAGTAAPNGVNILADGEKYNTAPTITAYGGHGLGMTFNPTVQAGGIVQIQITNPGTGYEVGDVVQLAFSGGGSDSSAILQANLGSGTVAAANVTGGGTGYTTATATFSGGGGSGAAGTVQISSGVSSLTITNPGSGYTGANVAFSGGGGTGASATATVNGGEITALTIDAAGSGYTSPPTVTITGDGTGATATAAVANGQVSGITITSGGSGYTSAPSITITGDGTGATAVALLSSSSISGVTVVNGGTGFTYAPGVSFVGGNGTGATGVATLTATSISKVNVVAGGQNYAKPPAVTFTGGGTGASGAAATAVLGGGQVIAVNVTSGGSGYTQNVEVVFTPAKNDPGTGAGAIAIFDATSIGGVIMSDYGQNYTDAPAVEIQPGANQSAYATVTLMPFGVSGSAMETYSSRVWILNPAPTSYQILPSGGNWQVSAPGSLTDFATSDGGVLFTNSDGFLQTQYTNVKQSNGYLYFFGDGSISVVSNVNTTGSPATTTFNYQNVDPQTGLSWRDSQQDFGRTLIFANETGVFGLYGGAATKISAKLENVFLNAVFPASGGLLPSSAVGTLFNVKHYMMLMTITDPDTNLPVNKMVTWNERDWVLTSQSVALTYIGAQKVDSKFTAWGADGNSLYPLFQTASPTLIKRLDTKMYGGDNPLIIKDFYSFYLSCQDQSSTLAGVNFDVEFNASGLAVQNNPVAPNLDTTSVASFLTAAPGPSLLFGPTIFTAPAPYFPVYGSGGGGAPFMSIQARLTTTSPDFILAHLAIGYTDQNAVL